MQDRLEATSTGSKVVKLFGIVSSTAEFKEQHLVLNGASDVMMQCFEARRCRARCPPRTEPDPTLTPAPAPTLTRSAAPRGECDRHEYSASRHLSDRGYRQGEALISLAV